MPDDLPAIQPHQELERDLRAVETIGTRIAHSPSREVWVFSSTGKKLRLHFYPRVGAKQLASNPAVREFFHLQQLQKAKIPANRPTALLQGFRLGDRLGDAVLMEELEGAESLEEFMRRHHSEGKIPPNRASIAKQVRAIIRQIGQLKLGCATLSLDSFWIRDGDVIFANGRGLNGGGMRLRDIQHLAHDARRFTTRTDLLRAWNQLGPGGRLPPINPVSERLWKQAVASADRGDGHLSGRIDGEGWRGLFTKSSPHPVPWSVASRLNSTEADWREAWPLLLQQIIAGQVQFLKQDSSGDVMLAEIVLQGRPIEVVVKRPKRNKWFRYITDLFRASRVRRVWIKAWKMTVRGVPVEWPMLVMEKKVFGYATDMLIVFERIPGQVLSQIDLDAIDARERNRLFTRLGRVLRKIESLGFTHFDAKSTNWIVYPGLGESGLLPVLLDLDGIRHYRWRMAGLERLLRAMKQNPLYTPRDSYALCKGYAPYARLVRE